jgi:hypothetical protein
MGNILVVFRAAEEATTNRGSVGKDGSGVENELVAFRYDATRNTRLSFVSVAFAQ